jgi:hypothetical protein
MRMKYSIASAMVFKDLLLSLGIYNSYREITHFSYRATETGSRLDCQSDGSLQSAQNSPS